MVLSGCANVSTTKFIYQEANGVSVVVEMPKELEAKNLSVEINAKEGKAFIKADSIQTLNVDTIKAQSSRESKFTESLSKGVSEGAVKGAMKGIIP